MIRRILLGTTLAALAGCGEPPLGDDAVVAQALGGIQPSLEAQNALLVAMDDCPSCANLQELGNYLGATLGSCARVEAVSKAESACTKIAGRSAARVSLNGCDFELGRPVSGTLVVTQADGSVMRYFETDLSTGDHGVVSCGEVSGAGGGHSLAFDAVAHGPTGGDVLLFWSGPTSADAQGTFVRSGSVNLQFTGGDGVGYIVEAEASQLKRAAGQSLPHAGSIAFQGLEGMAKIEFGAESPTTGGIRLTRSNGVVETVVVAR
ncbi:hypothetical protein [Vulgatibacter sp.]|uniref:hypothetical protein n=1 Tax=Vulgatibacter sp. TaxID=1971226 RepID=UPI0035613B41